MGESVIASFELFLGENGPKKVSRATAPETASSRKFRASPNLQKLGRNPSPRVRHGQYDHGLIGTLILG
jgi:hypothetical protein